MNRLAIIMTCALATVLALPACNSDLGALAGATLDATGSGSASVSTGERRRDALLEATGDVAKAATVSDADLQTYSRQMVASMDKQNTLAKPGNKYAARLERLVRRHVREDGLRLNFKVYLTKDVNAFATPDGSIRVFAGIMDLMSDDELRSIIGHEIGHVKHGHSLSAMRTAYLTSAGAKLAAAEGGLGSQLLTDLAEKFINAQFSQAQESESDTYGIAFLKRHKYNLPAAESAMRKLADLDGTAAGGSNSIFASHPGSKDRADRIHKLISQ
jgi:putative metalloprotease